MPFPILAAAVVGAVKAGAAIASVASTVKTVADTVSGLSGAAASVSGLVPGEGADRATKKLKRLQSASGQVANLSGRVGKGAKALTDKGSFLGKANDIFEGGQQKRTRDGRGRFLKPRKSIADTVTDETSARNNPQLIGTAANPSVQLFSLPGGVNDPGYPGTSYLEPVGHNATQDTIWENNLSGPPRPPDTEITDASMYEKSVSGYDTGTTNQSLIPANQQSSDAELETLGSSFGRLQKAITPLLAYFEGKGKDPTIESLLIAARSPETGVNLSSTESHALVNAIQQLSGGEGDSTGSVLQPMRDLSRFGSGELLRKAMNQMTTWSQELSRNPLHRGKLSNPVKSVGKLLSFAQGLFKGQSGEFANAPEQDRFPLMLAQAQKTLQQSGIEPHNISLEDLDATIRHQAWNSRDYEQEAKGKMLELKEEYEKIQDANPQMSVVDFVGSKTNAVNRYTPNEAQAITGPAGVVKGVNTVTPQGAEKPLGAGPEAPNPDYEEGKAYALGGPTEPVTVHPPVNPALGAPPPVQGGVGGGVPGPGGPVPAGAPGGHIPANAQAAQDAEDEDSNLIESGMITREVFLGSGIFNRTSAEQNRIDADVEGFGDMWKKNWNSMEASNVVEDSIRYMQCTVPNIDRRQFKRRRVTARAQARIKRALLQARITEPIVDTGQLIGLYSVDSNIFELPYARAPFQPLYAI
jgi:hypothetical protein